MMTDTNPSPIELTDEQKAIIKTDENTIVVANPGTGKTSTLALKVMELLQSNVEPDEILCLTTAVSSSVKTPSPITEIAVNMNISACNGSYSP